MEAVTMELMYSASTALILYVLPPLTISLLIVTMHQRRKSRRGLATRGIHFWSRILVLDYFLGLTAGIALLGTSVWIEVVQGSIRLSGGGSELVLVLGVVYTILYIAGLRVVISFSVDRDRKISNRHGSDQTTPLRAVRDCSMNGIDPIVD